ncbi:MAG: DHHA1 domain-containing protein [Eubacteriales bacterium]|nr:DHHA1 domain-containing protein [Eubacteriales bacterium]
MAKWMVYAKKEDFKAISQACGISQVLARVIRNRDVVGAESTRRFLRGGLADLYDPRLLPDMEKAAAILCAKIREGAPVRVIGDYDVDGICASYILLHTLAACGARSDVVLPDRVRDGYGMNPQMAQEAAQDGVGVILTCDNGIAASEAVRAAKEAGICVVVTDHHEVPFEDAEDSAEGEKKTAGTRKYLLPPADAVVDPKVRNPRTGQMDYPFPEICGAVVAWKLADLLLLALAPGLREQILEDLLPFCALATVCDVMPLLEENRILVREGLLRAARTTNTGLRSLLLVNGLEGTALSAYHAGFVIGPCLNATGRLDNAERALALFLEKDPQEALRSAQKLRELNDSRKSLTEKGVDQALCQVRERHLLDYRVMVIYLPDCHESLAGIIAGRVRERCSRPVFVLTKTEQGTVKGSGRSIEGYDMFASMTAVRDCFERFGGHRMAAGLSMQEEKIPLLQERLEEQCGLREEDLTEVLHIDMELPPALWTLPMAEEMRLLEPCGTANPRPLFGARGIRLHGVRIMGKGRNVLRFAASDARGAMITLVRFREADLFQEEVTAAAGRQAWEAMLAGCADLPVSMVYYPDINEWKGRKTLQFIVKDFHY